MYKKSKYDDKKAIAKLIISNRNNFILAEENNLNKTISPKISRLQYINTNKKNDTLTSIYTMYMIILTQLISKNKF